MLPKNYRHLQALQFITSQNFEPLGLILRLSEPGITANMGINHKSVKINEQADNFKITAMINHKQIILRLLPWVKQMEALDQLNWTMYKKENLTNKKINREEVSISISFFVIFNEFSLKLKKAKKKQFYITKSRSRQDGKNKKYTYAAYILFFITQQNLFFGALYYFIQILIEITLALLFLPQNSFGLKMKLYQNMIIISIFKFDFSQKNGQHNKLHFDDAVRKFSASQMKPSAKQRNWEQAIRQNFNEAEGTLNLVEKNINDRDIKNMLSSSQKGIFINIEKLIMEINNIGPEGIKHLATGNFQNLTVLSLQINNIGSKGAKYLAAGNFYCLTKLYLSNNNIGSEGLRQLANSRFNNLTLLSLYRNNIQAEGIKYLVVGNFENLEVLSLYNNRVGTEGAKYLSGSFANLVRLYLEHNSINEENKTHLRLLFKESSNLLSVKL